MQQNEIQKLLDKVNLLFSVLLKDGIENTTQIERELLKEQLEKLMKIIDDVQDEQVAVTEESEVVDKNTNIENTKLKVEEVVVNEEKEEPVIEFVNENVEETEPILVEPKTVKTENLIYNNKIKELIGDRSYSAKSPLRQMNQIIDLNKSFIFIQELFGNNSDKYKSFIQNVEQLETEKASLEFMSETAAEQNWDAQEKSFELMVKAIEKRFIPIL
ncbi:MAG: hypothetical protein H6578_12025 [Chitinophagales bacterium]|nr:hypothetical protein [Chitinophagales bacterium]